MTKQELLHAIDVISDGKKGEFAEKVGVSPETVSRWLGGKIKMRDQTVKLIKLMLKGR